MCSLLAIEIYVCSSVRFSKIPTQGTSIVLPNVEKVMMYIFEILKKHPDYHEACGKA